MEINNEPPVQEMVGNDNEQPAFEHDRTDSPGSNDEQLPNEESRRNRVHSAKRRRDKNAVINLILSGATSGGRSQNAMVFVSSNKNKSGGGRSGKRSKIYHELSNCQIFEPYSDRLIHKELDLHKKNAEILELMIKKNLPADTLKAFISKASFD